MNVTIIVKDVNDHAPMFSQFAYNFYLREDEQAGAVIGNVMAKDNDAGRNGRVDYYLEGADADLFAIKGVFSHSFCFN